jgi:hypothetical protein
VLDHGLVRELDERLGVGEGLRMASVLQLLLAPRGFSEGDIQEASDGCRTLRRE